MAKFRQSSLKPLPAKRPNENLVTARLICSQDCAEQAMELSFAFLRTLDELQFIYILSWTIILLAFITEICLIFLKAEYGRYFRSNSWQNCLCAVDARVAWFVQELPAFVIPCALLFYARKDALGLTPNTILLSLFFLHYSHR